MDSDAQLYDETFTVSSVSHEKYDRVARIYAHNGPRDTEISLDVNAELYPLSVGEQFQLVLAKTLNLDGSAEDKGWKDLQRSGERTLADDFDYVMRGKIYRTEAASELDMKIYISFGGLILFMQGSFRKLLSLKIDYVYLLVKK